jgi:hypothetical protein
MQSVFQLLVKWIPVGVIGFLGLSFLMSSQYVQGAFTFILTLGWFGITASEVLAKIPKKLLKGFLATLFAVVGFLGGVIVGVLLSIVAVLICALIGWLGGLLIGGLITLLISSLNTFNIHFPYISSIDLCAVKENSITFGPRCKTDLWSYITQGGAVLGAAIGAILGTLWTIFTGVAGSITGFSIPYKL